MKSSTEFPLQRKAFSARKSVVCDSIHLNDSLKQKLTEKKTLKSCASASVLIPSEKNNYLRNTQFYNSSNFHSRLKISYTGCNVEYEKLFLYASQILEKLNQMIYKLKGKLYDKTYLKPEAGSFQRICCHQIKFNLKRIILHRDVLKQMLEKRCLLILKEELNFNLRQTIMFLEETKELFSAEKLRMVTMPLQALNRFIGSTDISIFNMEVLLNKLQDIAGLQVSLNNSFQRIVNVLHLGFSMEMHQFVMKTFKTLEDLKHEMFYWVYKIVTISIVKLCLVDSNVLSSEFLQKILAIFERFSLLLSISKRGYRSNTRDFKLLCPLFANFFTSCDVTELSCAFVFHYLSMFESKLAAEKITHFFVSECKKHVHHKNNFFVSQQDRHFENINTSDYFSVTTSEVDSENQTKALTLGNMDNFSSVLSSLEQKNQALILKYLYAFACLNNSQFTESEVKPLHSSFKIQKAIRQTWKVPVSTNYNQNCMHLERVYWTNFWRKFQQHILKFLQVTSLHEYTNSSVGTFILWPDVYLHAMVDLLKLGTADNDISLDGKCFVQQIFVYLHTYLVLIAWDKRFSLALFSSSSHLCPPVPIVLNEVRTNPGNLLCLSLEPLVSVFSNSISQSELDINIKAIQQLQCTIDCFTLWSNNNCRAFVSSWNISAYMLISYSDCKHACKILENMKAFANSCMIHAERSSFRSSFRLLLWNSIRNQISNLEGIVSDAPNIVYKNVYILMTESINKLLKSQSYWTSIGNDSFCSEVSFAVEFILNPILETMNHISDSLFIVIASVKAIAEAFLDVLRSRTRPQSSNMKLLNLEVHKILQWIDNLEISQDDKIKIQSNYSLQKLISLLTQFRTSSPQQWNCLKRRNRIIPATEIGPCTQYSSYK